MKLKPTLAALLLIPLVVFGDRFKDIQELREFIVSYTPTTVEKSGSGHKGEDKEIYQIGGRLINNRVVGFHYSLTLTIPSQFEISDFLEFTKDTNAAVRAAGLLCLAKKKYDFEILDGDNDIIYITDNSCSPAEATTLEEFSRELKTNYRFQYYYGVISIDEHMLQQAIEQAKVFIQENELTADFDINQIVEAKASITIHDNLDIDKLYWDIYFLKKEGKSKPYMGLIRVYNGDRESELISFK